MGRGLSELQKHILVQAFSMHSGEWPRWAITASFSQLAACTTAEEFRAELARMASGVSEAISHLKGQADSGPQSTWEDYSRRQEDQRLALTQILTASGYDPQWHKGIEYAVVVFLDTRIEAEALMEKLEAQHTGKPVLFDCQLLLSVGRQPNGDLELWRIYNTFYGFPVRFTRRGREGGVRSAGRETEYNAARAAVSRAIVRLQQRDLVVGLRGFMGTRIRSVALTPTGVAVAERLTVNTNYVGVVNQYDDEFEFRL